MSVFKVNLNNTIQGNLDINPKTNSEFTVSSENPSIQRTIYVTGPNRIYRKLMDGDVFTDCNYWKKFAYPQMELGQAFIEIVEDDGSIYSPVPEENNFPTVYSLTVTDGSEYGDNLVDIVGDYGSPANFVQIANASGGGDVQVKLNGLAGAIFTLLAGDTQVFNYGDLAVTSLDFANSSGQDANVQVIASVQSKCLS
jgi:hypothetical protein